LASASDPLTAPLATLAADIDALERLAADRQRLLPRIARLRRAQRRIAAAVQAERRQERDLPPFGPLRAWLYPRDQPQERVMSLFQALWEHGPGLGPELVALATRLGPGERAVLRLG
jgi:hypothetical protein